MRRLLYFVIKSKICETNSSGATVTRSKFAMLFTGSSMVMPLSTTALDRFIPVTMPVRSPSRTRSALQSMSRMMRPAEAMLWNESMIAAGIR